MHPPSSDAPREARVARESGAARARAGAGPAAPRLIDFDQHYYEPDDCCTRYLEPRFRDRAVHVGELDGQRAWFLGDQPLGFDRRPNDFVLEPGELRRLFALDRETDDLSPRTMSSRADPAFRDRNARIEKLDAFGVEAAVLFSSFFFENEGARDPAAVCANLRAYNRWLAEEWGWAYRSRIFTPASLTLTDLDFAIRELERVLAEGARLILMRTGPVRGRSPADPCFDPFWARVNEARVPVLLHVSLSTYETEFSRLWGEKTDATMAEFSAFQWYTCFMHRPWLDTIASLIFGNLFGRFPGIRVVSVENGSAWVPGFLGDIDHVVRHTMPTSLWPGGRLHALPSEIFREHVYVSPFYEPHYEAPMETLVDLVGIDRLVFGSDWPHGEGKARPLDYVEDLDGLDEKQVERFMRGNALDLLGLGNA